jgi:hypothetical protein
MLHKNTSNSIAHKLTAESKIWRYLKTDGPYGTLQLGSTLDTLRVTMAGKFTYGT